ncbi:MAG TPA: hypothetical protein VF540_11755, partial [Segetibacter sp.]
MALFFLAGLYPVYRLYLRRTLVQTVWWPAVITQPQFRLLHKPYCANTTRQLLSSLVVFLY